MATKEAAASGEVQLLEAAGVRVPAAGEAVIRAVVPPLTAGVGLLATTSYQSGGAASWGSTAGYGASGEGS